MATSRYLLFLRYVAFFEFDAVVALVEDNSASTGATGPVLGSYTHWGTVGVPIGVSGYPVASSLKASTHAQASFSAFHRCWSSEPFFGWTCLCTNTTKL